MKATFLVILSQNLWRCGVVVKTTALLQSTNPELWFCTGSNTARAVFFKIFRKSNIFYSLIRTGTRAYLGVKNVSFSKYFAHVLNGWSLKKSQLNLQHQWQVMLLFLCKWRVKNYCHFKYGRFFLASSQPCSKL